MLYSDRRRSDPTVLLQHAPAHPLFALQVIDYGVQVNAGQNALHPPDPRIILLQGKMTPSEGSLDPLRSQA